MGAAADKYADQIIVTDDNPRSEDPESICRTIVRGIRSRGVRIIHDRGDAIATALNEAAPADIVLIAGKGHEEYQIYGDVRRRFSDRREAERHLRAVTGDAVTGDAVAGDAVVGALASDAVVGEERP
jgi:UDP-N-acetylmuramoyl-L-alanyl-D-glutamate--2,6-diaminopimelate ligase